MNTHNPAEPTQIQTNPADIDNEIGGKLTLAAAISIPAVLILNPTLIPVIAAKLAPGSYNEGLAWSIIALISVPVVLWSGSNIFKTARRDLKQGSVNLNTLIALAISIAFVYSLAITMLPGVQVAIPNARPYWDVLNIVVTLLVFKKFLLDKNA